MENKIQHKTLRLTQKQRKITELVAQGLLNKEIGHAVSLSENTIKAVMQGIFQRNGIKSRVILAVRFVEEKIYKEIREKQEAVLAAIEMSEIRRSNQEGFSRLQSLSRLPQLPPNASHFRS